MRNDNKKNAKIANAGLRVLEMLKILVQRPTTLNEIINSNEDNENTRNVYAKETISKYFNTLKIMGFKVDKVSNKFYLRANLDKISLDAKEIKTFCFLKQYAQSLNKCELGDNMRELFRIIENSLDDESRKLMNNSAGKGITLGNFTPDKSEKLIQKYEGYCRDHMKLRIRYKTRNQIRTYKIEPKNIVFKTNKVFLHGYNYVDNEYKEFLIANIEDSVRLPQKATDRNYLNPISFQLKGHLAKVYVMRENEKLMDMTDDTITVLNYDEDRENLMHRLLRYRDNCEVKYPKHYRAEFARYMDKILENYE